MPEDKSISAELPFESRFVEVAGSKIHYVEEGAGDPVLFLHGNPTSSYLWRNVIPHVSPHARAIAMDLVGMGLSDKPDIEYRFFDHYRYVEGFIAALGLKNAVLVGHDWGSALAVHYARRHESNVRGIALMEAILAPIESWDDLPDGMRKIFQGFRTPETGWDLIVNRNLFVERVLPESIVRDLTDEEMERYRAPFRDPEARKPVWRWPNEIPIAGDPADVVQAVAGYRRWLAETPLPKLLFEFTPGVLVSRAAVEYARAHWKNLKVVDGGEGIHFVQEDNPHKIGREIAAWLRGLRAAA